MRAGHRRAISAVCLVIALCALAAGPGSARAKVDFEYEKAFGPDGTTLSAFASVTSVAIDQSEKRVYVLDRKVDAVYKFDFAGNPVDFGGSSSDVSGNKLTVLPVANIFGARQIAVDSSTHTIYVPGEDPPLEWGGTVLQAFEADGDPAEFTAGTGAGTNRISGFHGLHGIAVDSSGNIYTAEFGDPADAGFKVFSPSGSILIADPGVGVSGPGGIAVDADGFVYIIRNESTAGRYTPSTFPVTSGTTYSEAEDLPAGPARAVATDPPALGLERAYVAEAFVEAGEPVARVSVFDQGGAIEGEFGGPGDDGELAKPTGIAAALDGKVVKAFVAHNPESGEGQVRIFRELLVVAAPEIQTIAADAVTGDSAKLRAKINPNNLETTYRFEYGTKNCAEAEAACAEVPIDGASIGSGRKGVSVEEGLGGLQANTVYHYRVVASNSEGTVASADKTVTTQGSGLGFSLSDSRAWEMVSPPNKFGGVLVAASDVVIQASTSNEGALVYASLGSIEGEPAGGRLPEPSTVLAERSEGGEWTSLDLTPPHSTATQLRADTEFNLFTPDLAVGEMEPTDDTPLSPESTEQTPYLWTGGQPPLFTPLITAANVPPETEFGPEPGAKSNPVRMEGATEDLKHVVLWSERVPLVEDAAPRSLYLWNAGQLKAVSQLPEGGKVGEGMLGSGRGSVRHAISSDGSRVFWTPSTIYNAAGIELPALYLRDTESGTSVRLDVKQAGASGTGPERPAFNAASADGRVAFFTDSQRLTKDSSLTGRDLYRCEVGPVKGGLGCAVLTDVSAPLPGSKESAAVLDQAPAISDDGSRLYFVARGVLDEDANDQGATAKGGSPNLYLFEEGQGVRFIAALSENDHLVWGGDTGVANKLGFGDRISAAASPSGRFLSFTSEESLTGYENENNKGARNTEVFVYDAEAGGGQLSCASCNPTGAAAVGRQLPDRVQFFPPDPGGLWAGRWVAATLPEATHTEPETGRSLYRPRSTLDNGRVFFNSVDALVPGDSNGNWDVYQYQPVGIGTCTAQTSSAAAVRSGSGCVSLISSGTSEGDAGFLDATPSGDDVFFLTKGRLSVTDKDNDFDAYDARVNGIPAVLDPVRECVGEACQPSVGPPNDPTPSSEAFNGAQTPLNCRKGQRKVHRNGRAVCVPKKNKKHGKKHKKKAGKSGRGQR